MFIANRLNLIILLLFSFLVSLPVSSFAQYTNFRLIEPREGDEPKPQAILWSKEKALALIYYNEEHINVVDGVRIDKEWRVKEIKKESIVFGRTSEKRYIEYYVNSDKRPYKHYKKWFFYGLPITFWEAVVLLSDGFEINAVMNNLCTGASVPHITSDNFYEILHSIIPRQNTYRVDGDTLYLFPTNTPYENWKKILNRRRNFNYKALALRFPGLEKEGVVISKGNDIQFVLRVISLGGEVPIKFPKKLHFAVYANFKKVPFYKILSDIVYTNQCVIVERETCLEVVPWVESLVNDENLDNQENEPVDDFIISEPNNIDIKSGSGPYPPPNSILPEIMTGSTLDISNYNNHPVVKQNFGFTNKSGDSE